MRGALVETRLGGERPVVVPNRTLPSRSDETSSPEGRWTSPDPGEAAARSGSDSSPDRDDDGSVVAVLAQRSDGTCVVYCEGRRGEWPSKGAAIEAITSWSPTLAWRESTPGVWVGRAAVAPTPGIPSEVR